MKQRKLLALVLVASLLMTFAGSMITAKAEEVKQELTYNAFADTAYYDPRNANGADHRTLLNQTFEPLIRKTADGQFLPGAAESWELSEDNTVITFKLRDMKWSDGEPVTAADYVFSYQTGADPAFASYSAGSYEVLLNGTAVINGEMAPEELGVEAVDELTLKCTLAKADPFVLSAFSSVNLAAVPSHIADVDSTEWTLYPETAVSNGPFMMTEWLPKEKITMEPNPYYYNREKVKLTKLIYVFVDDPNTALNGFRNGDIDVMTQLPTTEVAGMLESGELIISPRVGTYYYAFNMNGLGTVKDEAVLEAMQKPEVRKALNLAIDREALVKTVTMTGETPAYGFLPEGIYDPEGNDFRKGKSYFDPKGDVEEAQRLLAEAGYPNGEGFPTLDIFYNTSETHKLIGEAIQEMWRKNLGITVTLSNKETAVFAEERRQGMHQIARCGNLGDDYNAASLLGLFTTQELSSGNEAKWVDPAFEAIMDQIKLETDVTKIFELSRQAEDILMDVTPVIPIYYYTYINVVQLDVKGVTRDASGSLLFYDAYIE